MNLETEIIHETDSLVTFKLIDTDTDKWIVRNYTRNDLPQLRQVIDSSQKYFLYLEHGKRAAEEYKIRKKELQANMSKVVEQLTEEREIDV